MPKTLLICFFFFLSHQGIADDSVKDFSQIAKGNTRDDIKTLEKTFATLKPEDKSNVAFIIASNQQVFQRCYEENLPKDDLLSGNASIILNIGKSANLSFKGIGQEEIKNELRKCLSKKAVAMSFSNKYQGKSVKFSLFFNN